MRGRWPRWLQARGGAPAGTGGVARIAPDDAAAARPTRVLLVCMGNICRSPTAEGVLRACLQRAGLQARVEVDSAGTHGYHSGEPPDPRAIRHAAARGYDIAALRARAVSADDYAHFDLMLAMDEENLRWLRAHSPPAAAARIELLMAHATRYADRREVPDPYYGTAAGFEHVLDLVEDACAGLVDRLQAGPAPEPTARKLPPRGNA
jgi:protein-tyrosine phosphatase